MLEKLEPIASIGEATVRGFRFPECTELSAPILAFESAVAGYGDTPILNRLTLRIDNDDRIALLGANGQGKSTFAKSIAGRLDLLTGTRTAAPKLKIGYFAQHQMEDLDGTLTPLQELAARKPETPTKLRAILALSLIHI